MLQAARRAAFFAASVLFCFLIWIPDNVDASREYKTTSHFFLLLPHLILSQYTHNNFFPDDYNKIYMKKKIRKIKYHHISNKSVVKTDIIPDPWQIQMTMQKIKMKNKTKRRKKNDTYTNTYKKNERNKNKKKSVKFPI